MFIVKITEPFTTITTKGRVNITIFDKKSNPSSVKFYLNSYYYDDCLKLLYINCEDPSRGYSILYDQYQEEHYINTDFKLHRENDNKNMPDVYSMRLKSSEKIRNVTCEGEEVDVAYCRDALFYEYDNLYYIDGDEVYINFNPEKCTVTIFDT